MSLVELKNVTKTFGRVTALDDVNIKFEKGKIYGLLGPNGSGKSTMIKVINDLLQPTSGEVFVESKTPGIESKKVISYLPERTYLNMDMKVNEILAYFEDFYEDFDKEKALELLKRLNIEPNNKKFN